MSDEEKEHASESDGVNLTQILKQNSIIKSLDWTAVIDHPHDHAPTS